MRTTTVTLLLALALVPARPAPAAAGPLAWLKRQGHAVQQRLQQSAARRQTVRTLRSIDPLLVPAFKAMKHAHAPYSGAHLGAALSVRRQGALSRVPLLRNRIVRGFNSESEGDLQICAERAAMAGLPRDLAARSPVRKIAVVSDGGVPTPCGRCLQVLSEVGSPETKIVAANLKGKHRTFRLGDLLPTGLAPSPRSALKPHRPLMAQAVRAYRRSLKSGVNRYRPPFGAVVQTDDGRTYLGMVLKDTASTFTPATQTPLDLVAQRAALEGRRHRVRTVVIAGEGRGGKLPLPTADERQHLVDMNPDARVVLYNPKTRTGAVTTARDLLPHAYQR